MGCDVFLRDWRPGDVVTADDLQALADAVAMLEAGAAEAVTAPALGGVYRHAGDGPVGWPWQVYAVHGEAGLVLRVVPGRVFTGARAQVATDGGEAAVADGVYEFLTLPATAGADVVPDYEASAAVATVYLVMTGSVSREYVRRDEFPGATAADVWQERVVLADAALRVCCVPPEDALRVWPLAVVNRGHVQPVTQLLWGDLSALECRGIGDSAGGVVWPASRAGAATWGTRAHAKGMSVVAPLEFRTAVEEISGALYGCLDEDGAVEFYLGQFDEEEVPTTSVDEEETEDEFGDGDGGGGGAPQETEPAPGGVTRVKYGYVAGEGFLSCTLVQGADGLLYWELVLDPDFLAGCCKGLQVPVTVTYGAGGTQQGTHDTVEMGLGDCAASTTGMLLRGTAQLVFHGRNAVDASKKSATAKVKYVASPEWRQERKWLLSPALVHEAGAYVRREEASPGWQPGGFVEAMRWYRFSVKRTAFRRNALAFLRAEMAKITVQDEDVSVSYDSEVRAVLSGTLTAPVFTMSLGDSE